MYLLLRSWGQSGPKQGVMMRNLKRVVCAFTATVVMAAGMAVAAPAATADSRCNTRNHTHGVSFWQRTDSFVSKYYVTNQHNNRQMQHQHTNSGPVLC